MSTDDSPWPQTPDLPGHEPARHVTFLHGLGGSPLSWEEQVSKLPRDLPAVAPWLKGMRPGGNDEFTLAGAVGDVLLSRQLDGVSTGALVGHSLGAMVALQCALDDADSVSHLVLVAGQARPPKAVMQLQRVALKFVSKRRLAAQGVSKEKLMEALRDGSQFDAQGSLDQIRCPTLVVCGSRDRPDQPAAKHMAAAIPRARLEIIDGAGHDVMRDATPTFNALLYDFLGHPLPG